MPETTSESAIDALAPYIDRLRQNVSEFTLDNGLRFIVMERHDAPVVSFVTYANVGGVDEPVGKTGVAHYLEHLAFKGTKTIGTTDYAAEQKIFDQLDRTFNQIQRLQKLGKTQSLERLEARFNTLKAEASQLVRQNELGQVIEREGGVGLNAATSSDATTYFYSLPSNKLELWMYLESERFRDPIFREFYEEKDVILEERRMRFDNDPVSQLFEAMKNKAFAVHPYGQPLIGHVEDLRSLTRQDVQRFFNQHYGPENLTLAVVGDVDKDQVQRLAKTYFGRPRRGGLAKAGLGQGGDRTATIPPEPAQTETRSVELRAPAQPWYVEAYHIPSMAAPDYVAYAVLGDILSSGRTSRLYRSLVETEQVALSARGMAGYPGDKYPNLLVFYALVAPGHRLEEVEASLHAQLEAMVAKPPEEAELARVKRQLKTSVLRSLKSNQGMASVLTEYQAKTGSWENLIRDLEAIARLTPADIQRVAQTTLRPENRTVARLLPETQAPETQAPKTKP
ncbi:MAG: insulinase family protein [Synechococcales cyanobacterium CRU_2_2]|nr:insulinase family protein [Synechococcales cyanobacterium CRU_2_2]